MYCRYCGKETHGDATVCKACMNKAKNTDVRKGKRKHIILISALLLILVFVGLYVLFNTLVNREEKAVAAELDTLLIVRETTSEDDLGTEIGNELLGNVSYEIQSIQGNMANIIVHAPNINSLYKQALDEIGSAVPKSEEEYASLLNEVLSKVNEWLTQGRFDYLTTEIAINIQENGSIEVSYELIDALYGGLLTLQEELVAEYIGGDGQ